jgi:hypothetical protein
MWAGAPRRTNRCMVFTYSALTGPSHRTLGICTRLSIKAVAIGAAA